MRKVRTGLWLIREKCGKLKKRFQLIWEKCGDIKKRFLDYRQRAWKDTGRLLSVSAVLLFSICVGCMAGTFMRPVWIGTLLVFFLAVPLTMAGLWFLKKCIQLLLRNGIAECLSWLLLWLVCLMLLAGDIPEEQMWAAAGSSLLLSLVLAMLLKSLWALMHHKVRGKTVAAVSAATVILSTGALALLAGQGFRDTYIETYRSLGVQQQIEHAREEPLSEQERKAFAEFGEPGSYTVLTASYGTGDADALESGKVNISRFAKNEGIDGFFKEKYQGYPLTEVPLSGIVWYPKETSDCPVLFIVHGNHNWVTDSYLGYEYLGTFLASHGYVVVSVDENACNGLSGENDGRAVLLLENIRQLETYNKQKGSPLYQKMDYDNLALAGHSRGGEAVAAAYLFNGLSYYPDNGNRAFDYHFSIRSLIAIAPTCGQYRPSGRDVELKDVNYMLIHGANDQDVNSFMGMEQYENLTFSGKGNYIKTSLYLAGVNHGQFNSQWGKYDLMEPVNRGLNVKNFLSQREQQQIAKLFIRAFLDETLAENAGKGDIPEDVQERSAQSGASEDIGTQPAQSGASEDIGTQPAKSGSKPYGSLLVNCRKYEELLPETLYVQSYQTSDFLTLCDFEEDIRLETGTAPGVWVKAEHVDSWREELLTFSNGNSRENHGVVLKWEPKEGDSKDRDGRAELCFFMPEMDFTGKCFQFDVMDLQEDFTEDEAELLEMEILFGDRTGKETVLDVGMYSRIYPAFLVRLNKLQYLWGAVEYKHQFQTVSIPAEALQGVDKENICKVVIRFRGEKGKAAVDHVGIRGAL